MDDETPTLPIVCEACGTTTRVPLDEAGETVERHNDRLHDGEEVAGIDPDLLDSLHDLVAADLIEED
jgi:hypothetical protein